MHPHNAWSHSAAQGARCHPQQRTKAGSGRCSVAAALLTVQCHPTGRRCSACRRRCFDARRHGVETDAAIHLHSSSIGVRGKSATPQNTNIVNQRNMLCGARVLCWHTLIGTCFGRSVARSERVKTLCSCAWNNHHSKSACVERTPITQWR